MQIFHRNLGVVYLNPKILPFLVFGDDIAVSSCPSALLQTCDTACEFVVVEKLWLLQLESQKTTFFEDIRPY